MAGYDLQVLTPEQAQQFIKKGYVVVKGCFDRAFAKRWTDEAYVRLGYDPNDPSTWTEEIVWMDRHNTAPIWEISPRGWGAFCDVVGGADRIEDKVMEIESRHFTTINAREWSDAFVVNFRRGADKPWMPPSAAAGGWHKDGSFFRHFLDSREQALLTVVMWSDMRHQGGGTFLAPDSVRLMARHLAEHPEGVHPSDFKFAEMIKQCERFEELTVEAGDFVIIHPFMLHASSQNVLRRPRFMSNPPVVLKEPLNLNRPDPADFSLLERATLHYLGVDRYDFQPTAPRESFWWPVD